ncbi:hypothetical protein ACT2FY_00765 [Paraburkholderia fungorum]|uniref:hypothetical protein n=1 Tax=Paraburkholderia fungorum TaxID=134537 RepID=UPI00402B1AAD
MKLSYEGVLSAPRRTAMHAHSKYHIPLFSDERDFASFEMIGRTAWTASLVNYEEMYALLAQIVTAVRRHAGAAVDEILLNSRMPATSRMPRELFGADIFLVHDVAAEAQLLLAEQCSFVTMREGFVRDYIEAGSNELLLDWYAPPPDGDMRLAAIVGELVALGIETRRIAHLPARLL